MKNRNNGIWSVVLAAGDGTRLSTLTTSDKGEMIPKQFCSLSRRECLLDLALHRAAHISFPDQICTIVAAQHRRWWRDLLKTQWPPGIIVQPRNRGTAIGTALALLHIEQQDPEATAVLLPADHYVDDERKLSMSLADVANYSISDPQSVYLLGALPDDADSELGYIVPQVGQSPVRPVANFVEKPGIEEARSLLEVGALWNMFIVAGSVRAILELMEMSYNFVPLMRDALRDSARVGALSRLYDDLPVVDFSRDVLAHYPNKLKVLAVSQCGWTDLGTPKRVAATVRNHIDIHAETRSSAMYWDLAQAVGAT